MGADTLRMRWTFAECGWGLLGLGLLALVLLVKHLMGTHRGRARSRRSSVTFLKRVMVAG